ncbi:TRAP transporter substrate-binding protein DctP [Leucobacter triazinivorans]|uniref:C4-dicarboxylate ABC transporter substrate-binding protein n=1 Tax=Leucobacter triazinivorans TaxID=1784719 RepID=A0A4P6KDS3_9MICO|nr:TRAP transporter substrate-binding protein DctP [Leucobacter triazinivorans]QBE48081.1 C4-dicarboxylate ABC transporter substrate-binding protein [Leucobacter triazinivorans]
MSARRRLTALALIASGALALTGCAGSSPDGDSGGEIKLTYAFFAPAASFPAVQMQEWADQLNAKTDGQVEVELFVGGTLLGAGDIYEGVSQGVVDVGLDSPAYDTSRFPLSSVINVPLGLTDPAVSSRVFLDLLTEFAPEEYQDYEVITAFTTEASYLQTLTPVTRRADLQGTTFRGTAATIPVLEELGTSPVGLPMNEVSEQLNTSVIDGYASSREVLKDFGLAESVTHITDYPIGISNSFVAVMDKAKFDALPEDVQDAIVDLREEMSQFAAEEHAAGIEASLAYAEEQGVETVDVDASDVAAWDSILEDRATAWVEANADAPFDAQAVLDRARELAAENG